MLKVTNVSASNTCLKLSGAQTFTRQVRVIGVLVIRFLANTSPNYWGTTHKDAPHFQGLHPRISQKKTVTISRSTRHFLRFSPARNAYDDKKAEAFARVYDRKSTSLEERRQIFATSDPEVI
jgi:hypothetical protein